MKFVNTLIICIVLTSCTDTTGSKKTATLEQVENISILLSGRGREIEVTDSTKSVIIPDELVCEVYLIELNKDGLLKTSLGYGNTYREENSDRVNLKMNFVERTDSIFLNKKIINSIFNMAEKMYPDEEYLSVASPTDSWLIKLRLNDKTSIYYSGEPIGPLSKLRREYLDIIDELVKESPIKVREYR